MLKILQDRFQLYVNQERPDVQAGFRKGRGTRDQIVKICWIIKKERVPEKTSISASLITWKHLTKWITANYGKFFKRWEYQTALPVSWETCVLVKKPVKILHETTNWFKIGKGVSQGLYIVTLFKLYAECLMWNEAADESQAEDCQKKY